MLKDARVVGWALFSSSSCVPGEHFVLYDGMVSCLLICTHVSNSAGINLGLACCILIGGCEAEREISRSTVVDALLEGVCHINLMVLLVRSSWFVARPCYFLFVFFRLFFYSSLTCFWLLLTVFFVLN